MRKSELVINKTKLIGITGKLHTGKDEIAKYFVKNYKYIQCGFADPLKYVCAELFLDNPKDFFSEEGKKEVMSYWGITRRAALQFVGTELVREHLSKLFYRATGEGSVNRAKDMASNHWIRVMEKRIQDSKLSRVAINDLRFQNEADWIIERGGIIINVERQIIKFEDDGAEGIQNHSSEAGIILDKYGDRAYEIDNNGSIESLHEQIERIAQANNSFIS